MSVTGRGDVSDDLQENKFHLRFLINQYTKMITKSFKLTIELVPSTIWYKNLYKYYKDKNQIEKWSELKQILFKNEGRQCWICKKETNRLEAHELWQYDDFKHIQKLEAIHHICNLCHKIKHIGFWCHTEEGIRKLKRQNSTKDDLINHFRDVNKCTQEDFLKHEDKAFETYRKRSKFKWKQNLGEYDPKYDLKPMKTQQRLTE